MLILCPKCHTGFIKTHDLNCPCCGFNDSRELKYVSLNLIDYDTLPINKQSFELAQKIHKGLAYPAVHLQRLKGGRFRLREGRHRYVACKLIGYKKIFARISLMEAQND